MMSARSAGHFLALLLVCAVVAQAQSLVLMKVDGKSLPVHRVEGLVPEVMVRGHLQRVANPSGILLLSAASYHDVFTKQG
jgi:hypothetical protein